jgi:tetratricopeptide (TPR) repeat protein
VRHVCLLAACALAAAGPATPKDPLLEQRIATLEAAVERAPEDLITAADYRQLVIASGEFDRSIRVLEKLAREKTAGTNVHLSLGLAYVDKVPTSGEIRRLYLARDAIAEATRAIDREPSVLAYYLRGRVCLYLNNLLFKRAAQGIQDLQKALTLITPQTPAPIAADVYAALGDGYWWRFEDRAAARDAWHRGADRYPDDAALKIRLSADDEVVANAVWKALRPDIRVDTSLRGLRR